MFNIQAWFPLETMVHALVNGSSQATEGFLVHGIAKSRSGLNHPTDLQRESVPLKLSGRGGGEEEFHLFPTFRNDPVLQSLYLPSSPPAKTHIPKFSFSELNVVKRYLDKFD